jgi:hypothetical protein
MQGSCEKQKKYSGQQWDTQKRYFFCTAVHGMLGEKERRKHDSVTDEGGPKITQSVQF